MLSPIIKSVVKIQKKWILTKQKNPRPAWVLKFESGVGRPLDGLRKTL